MSLNVAEETIMALRNTETHYRRLLSNCSDEKMKVELKSRIREVEDELGNYLNMVIK